MFQNVHVHLNKGFNELPGDLLVVCLAVTKINVFFIYTTIKW